MPIGIGVTLEREGGGPDRINLGAEWMAPESAEAEAAGSAGFSVVVR